MPICLFILLSALIGFNINLSHARTAADVVYYHYRAAQQGKMNQLPLFPEEPTISGFPQPLTKQSASLQALMTYYLEIVNAYKQEYKALQTLVRKAPLIKAAINNDAPIETDLSYTGAPQFDKTPFSVPSAVQANDQTLGEQIEDLKAKIVFYQSLADASTELNHGMLTSSLHPIKGEAP